MIFAEAVSIDGGLLLLILVVLFVLFALWCAAVFLGCKWARRAGQGSRRALVGWAAAAALAVVPLVTELQPLGVALALAVLSVQGWLYLRAKAAAAAAEDDR